MPADAAFWSEPLRRPAEGAAVLPTEDTVFRRCFVRNRFLAGCGFLGDLSCDLSQQVGYF